MGQHSIVVENVEVMITNPDKLLWKDITKADYLNYLATIAPLMLPFLQNKPLTIIRFPDGVNGEAFYQRNCPEYAPDYIKTVKHSGNNYIICSDLASLLWLGNQGAIEFHVPFSPYQSQKPSEIVFDLDPPSQKAFPLAIQAAKQIKSNLDRLNLTGFLKLSGNKGLQVHIPLPFDQYTYKETRLFTTFMADYLVETNPKLFTTERFKKNRHGRLYIDYVQHAAGKTIIAPYSTRGNADALVAAPIEWEELRDQLSPKSFSMTTVCKRKTAPFHHYEEVRDQQPFEKILDWLIDLSKK